MLSKQLCSATMAIEIDSPLMSWPSPLELSASMGAANGFHALTYPVGQPPLPALPPGTITPISVLSHQLSPMFLGFRQGGLLLPWLPSGNEKALSFSLCHQLIYISRH